MTDDRPPRTDWLSTADGERLETAWSGPADPEAVVVLTHPHPSYGGDMHNIVPASLARSLPEEGLATLRFNFRGVGSSTGTHGGGGDEMADVRAAIDAASEAHPGAPVVAVGYSFGADVVLAVDDPRCAGVVAIAPPLAVLSAEQFARARGSAPTLVLAAQHDQIRDAGEADTITSSWPDTTFHVLTGADHFLAGQTEEIGRRVAAFVRPISRREPPRPAR